MGTNGGRREEKIGRWGDGEKNFGFGIANCEFKMGRRISDLGLRIANLRWEEEQKIRKEKEDAIADKGDRNHDNALQFRDEIAGKYTLVTTNYCSVKVTMTGHVFPLTPALSQREREIAPLSL